MALQKHTREIGSFTYSTTTLDAVKGRKLLVKLANTLGAAMAGAGSDREVAANLLAKFGPSDVDSLCDTFGPVSTVTGGEYEDKEPPLVGKTFMEHFAGDYGAMLEWLAFCLEVNFGSFFHDAKKKVDQLLPADKAKAPKVA